MTLQEAREQYGLSREKVAARIGVSSKTIERWEKGSTPIRRYQLLALADLYGVDPETVEVHARQDDVRA